MADESNPFGSYSEADQISIRDQLHALRNSGKLNDKQNQSVGKLLLQLPLPPESGTISAREPHYSAGTQVDRFQRYLKQQFPGDVAERFNEPVLPFMGDIAQRSGEAAQGESRKAFGPEAEGKGFLSRAYHEIHSIELGANQLASQLLGGFSPKDVAIIGGSLLTEQPEIATAYYATMGASSAIGAGRNSSSVKEAVKNPTPDNTSKALMDLMMATLPLVHAAETFPDWTRRAKVPKNISLYAEDQLVKLGWSREEIANMRPEDAQGILKGAVRRETWKPPAKPPKPGALMVRPKTLEQKTAGGIDLRPRKGFPEPPAPPKRPSGEMEGPAKIEGHPEPVHIVEGARSKIDSVPQELRGTAAWLDEKREQYIRELEDARKRGADEEAARLDKKLKVIDRRRTFLTQASTEPTSTPSSAASGSPSGVPEPPAPPPSPPGLFGTQESPRNTPSEVPEKTPPTEQPAPTETAHSEAAPSSPIVAKQMNESEIHSDPSRFQVRTVPSERTAGAKKWKPELGGILTVWRDPKDGKVYVVNGHNRLDLIRRDPAAKGIMVNVQEIQAKDAQEARSIGAKINIAEGSLDPVDAAQYIRDSGSSAADLEEFGVSLESKQTKDAMALANLSEPLFNQVKTGEMPTGRGAAIGRYLTDPAEQEGLAKLIKAEGKKGEHLTNAEIEILARRVKDAGTTSTEEQNLFGKQQITESNVMHEARLEAYIRKRLSNDKRLFGYVSKSGRAEELRRGGNVIDVEKSDQVKKAAEISLSVFDKLISRVGPLNDAIKAGARKLAAGEDEADVKKETYETTLTAVQKALRRGEEERGGGRTQSPPRPSGPPQAKLEERLDERPRFVRTAPPPPPPADEVDPVEETPETGRMADRAGNQPGGTLGRFASESVAPAARETAANVLGIAHWVRKTFAPETVDSASRKMGLIKNDRWAWLQNERTRTHEAMKAYEAMFDRMPEEQRLDWIKRFESGQTFGDPKLQRLAELWRDMQRSTWAQVAKRRGINVFLDDYFPHIWKNPEEASEAYAKVYGKRPMFGPKSFFKPRSLPSIADGLAAGLELVDTNPVRLMEAKLHEMRRYITGYDIMDEGEKNGLVTIKSVFTSPKDIPEGLKKIEGPLGTVYGKPSMTIQEAYDLNLFDQLNDFARSLGAKTARKVSTPGGVLGYYDPQTQQVVTRVATPMATLTHEIGHHIDMQYDLAKQMVNHPELKQELRDLADERFRGKEDQITEGYKKYVRKGHEKMANLVDAYVNAPDLLERVAPQSKLFFEDFLRSHDELRPMLDIRPSLAREQAEYEVRTPGIPIIAYRYMPEAAANIINNHLSPGLRETSPLFRGYLAANNALNRFQLGWSLFHFTFTGEDTGISKTALGIQQIFSGKPVTGLKSIAKGVIPGLPAIEAYTRGSKFMKTLLETGPQSELDRLALQQFNQAGGRIKMDSFYTNSAVESFWRAWRSGNKISAGLKAPYAIVEEVSKPVMEDWVPKLKLGVYLDLAEQEVSKLGPDADVFAQRAARQRAWASVDNRLGQLVYDNLNWHKAVKDLGLASVRSLGWNLGSLREIPGGAYDLARGRITPKAAYVLALPVVIGLHGMILQYLLTGKGPTELKDYYFPKTGKMLPDGREERVMLPSYVKDVYNYGEGFRYGVGPGFEQLGRTAANKMAPLTGGVMEMLKNRDYYGTKIRNSDDPLIKQLQDTVEYMAGQFEPISARNVAKRLEESGGNILSLAGIESILGIAPASRSVYQSKAEYLSDEYIRDQIPAGARDRQQAERAQLRSEMVRRMRLKDVGAFEDIRKDIAAGKLTFDDQTRILNQARRSALETKFSHLPLKHAIKVFEAATDDERKVLAPMLLSKSTLARNLSPEEYRQTREKVIELVGEKRESTPAKPASSGIVTPFTVPAPPAPPQ